MNKLLLILLLFVQVIHCSNTTFTVTASIHDKVGLNLSYSECLLEGSILDSPDENGFKVSSILNETNFSGICKYSYKSNWDFATVAFAWWLDLNYNEFYSVTTTKDFHSFEIQEGRGYISYYIVSSC